MKAFFAGCGLLAALLAPSRLTAGDYLNLYERATLEHWQKLTPEDIEWNFRNVVLPVLTPAEKRQIGRVDLDFPLMGEKASEPFHFVSRYPLDRTSSAVSKIVLSMLSLRFFGDLALANAWLQANGYLTDTVGDYVAMLKYRPAASFPGGRLPSPLTALQIPDNARDHAPSYDTFSKIYKSAIVFILAHELGHIYHRHGGYGPDVARARSRRNEEDADTFAVEVMRRIGVAPIGMTVYFTLHAHAVPNRWDFANEAEYRTYLEQSTHPLTPLRLQALARRITEARADFARKETNPETAVAMLRYVAAQIAVIAGFLEDDDVLKAMTVVGRTTDLPALARRRPGELPLQDGGAAGRPVSTQPFDGAYAGTAGWANEELRSLMLLERKGTAVTGSYSIGLGMGRIAGQIEDGVLFFEWHSGTLSGKGILQQNGDGASVSGTWGHGTSRTDAGKWSAKRVETPPPLPKRP